VSIAGFSQAESAPILDFLYRHQTRAEFTCRFRWRRDSLAFWDNRATQHYPLNDYHGQHRAMQRITLAGDRPR
jgi:taurine dioxygenase